MWIIVTVEEMKDQGVWDKHCRKHKLSKAQYNDEDKIELTPREERLYGFIKPMKGKEKSDEPLHSTGSGRKRRRTARSVPGKQHG